MFLSLLQREFKSLQAQAGLGIQALFLYAMILFLFPLLLGAWPHLLAQVAAPFFWVLSLLMIFIVMPHIIQKDVDDGGLDMLRTYPVSVLSILISKGLTLILGMGVPLALISFLMAPLYGIGPETTFFLVATLLVGAPVVISFVLFGAVLGASSLTSGSFLIAFLILPFTVPLVLISLQVIEEESFGGSFRLLLAFILVMIPLSLGMTSYLMKDVFAR